MFLSAYESIQACQMMEELLGQVKARILEVYWLEFQVGFEHKQRDSHFARQSKVPCQNAIFARWNAPCQIWQGEFTHDTKIWHFASWVIHLAKISQGAFYLAKFPLFVHARTTDFPNIFSLIFSRVNSFCNLVFSRHKALSCNFAIYRGAQRLKKGGMIGWSILCTLI